MNNNEENKKMSRTKRNGTERRRHKSIYFGVIGVLLFILLFLVISIFSGGDTDTTQQAQETEETMLVVDTADTTQLSSEDTASDNTEETDSSENTDNEEETEEPNEEENEETNIESAEPSDGLVTEAYTGDWNPIGTSQEGSHNTNFSSGSQDRIEIKQAASMVTGLNPDNMIEWWVGNDGPDKVIATVSDRQETEIYRVYLSWVDGEGWQPTKVEELRENDKR